MIQAVLKKVRMESNANEKQLSKQEQMMAKIEAAAKGAFQKDIAAGHAVILQAATPTPSTSTSGGAPPPPDARLHSARPPSPTPLENDTPTKTRKVASSRDSRPKDPPPPKAPPVIDENTGMGQWESCEPVVPLSTLTTKQSKGSKNKSSTAIEAEPQEPSATVEEESVTFAEKKLEGGLKRKRGEVAGSVKFKKRKRPNGK